MKLSTCTNDRCEHGWITVRAEYVDRIVPDPEHVPDDPEAAAAIEAEIARLRKLHAGDVYPCRHCQPNLFFRWADGHHEPGHECAECASLRTGRKRSRSRPERSEDPPPAPELPERKDLA